MCPVSGLGDTEPLGTEEKQERKGCAGKRGEKIALLTATSLGSFVSHERVIVSPLGRPAREQQGDAVKLKSTSAQNSLYASVFTPLQMGL